MRNIIWLFYRSLTLLVVLAYQPLFADVFVLDPFVVVGRSDALIGETISASQGFIGQEELQYRPILRTGEILETIPGFIATQHSGSGKGNQYFLRGFNLDHGTDFATFVDGMPVNLPTHGHGQGYSDINFVIPELVQNIEYMKGPYYGSVGDFSSAGSGHISTMSHLDKGLAVLNLGENSFLRGVIADSHKIGESDLLAAFEAQYYDGPWDIGENLNKYNALIKYSKHTDTRSYGITFMAYDAEWDSADQIPERRVEAGIISDLGSIDDDLGGETSRYSLSANFAQINEDSVLQANAYAIHYDLNLWSNFTYFLDDPVNGDEFEQVDDRFVYGGSVAYTVNSQELLNTPMHHTFGAQVRIDDIDDVALYDTVSRRRRNTVRQDDVLQTALGFFYENEIEWTNQLRSIFGVRADHYYFDVDSNIDANSGYEDDFLVSPKLNIIYAPTQDLELFVSAGFGFHSNDARGTTITVDPEDGTTPASKVDPLVRSFGTEVGTRLTWSEKLNTSISLWYLELDSELLFVGDAGTTEASRSSQRYGLEVANYYSPFKGLNFELDASFTEAKFDDNNPAGDEIPGALDTVVSAAVVGQLESGWLASMRLRHFGPRPLIEDGSQKSDSTTVVNLRAGYQRETWAIFLDVLNLFDSDDDDITYFYESRLPGELANGVEDVHFHVIEPRAVRAYFSYRF